MHLQRLALFLPSCFRSWNNRTSLIISFFYLFLSRKNLNPRIPCHPSYMITTTNIVMQKTICKRIDTRQTIHPGCFSRHHWRVFLPSIKVFLTVTLDCCFPPSGNKPFIQSKRKFTISLVQYTHTHMIMANCHPLFPAQYWKISQHQLCIYRGQKKWHQLERNVPTSPSPKASRLFGPPSSHGNSWFKSRTNE